MLRSILSLPPVRLVNQIRLPCPLQVFCFSRPLSSPSTPTSSVSIASLLLNAPTHKAKNIDPSPPPDSLGPQITGEIVTVNGWVRSTRNMKHVSFVHLSDGSTVQPLQAVIPRTCMDTKLLTSGTSMQITGALKACSGPRKQDCELHYEKIIIYGHSDSETYPLQKKYQTPEYLRSIAHLRCRTPSNVALLKLRSWTTARITNFFVSQDFVQTHPPIITSSDCEGAGEVFSVTTSGDPPLATPPTIPSSAPSSTAKEHFFKSPKYLTVSSQLHLEALAHSIPKVWTLSPTFRAEKSDTNRHLSEFYMLEAEISFTNSLEDVMSLVEALTRDIAMGLMGSRVGHEIINLYQNRSLEEKAEGNNIVGGLEERIQSLIRPKPWRRITYTEGISILQDAVEKRTVKFVFEPTWGNALQAEHEKYLAEQYGGDETGAGGPIFVTDYPKQLKPFYMLSSNAYTEEQLDTFPATESTHESSSPSSAPLSEGVNSETVACFDLLLPGVGELAGGSLREHRYDELVSSMVKHGIIPSAEESEMGHMKWYADLRKWGSVRHGGFGMGYERLLAFLAGVENVREVVAFPRWAGKCDF